MFCFNQLKVQKAGNYIDHTALIHKALLPAGNREYFPGFPTFSMESIYFVFVISEKKILPVTW